MLLFWVVFLLIVSFVAAIFGFTDLAVAAAGLAKIIFFVFVVLFLVALVFYIVGRLRR